MKELYYLYNDGHNPFPKLKKGRGLQEDDDARHDPAFIRQQNEEATFGSIDAQIDSLKKYSSFDRGMMMDDMVHYYDARPEIQEYIRSKLIPIAAHYGIEYDPSKEYRDQFNEKYKDYHELVGDKYDDDEELDAMPMRKKLSIEHKTIKIKADEKAKKRADLEERVRLAKEAQQLNPLEVDFAVSDGAMKTIMNSINKNNFIKDFGRLYDTPEQAKKVQEAISEYYDASNKISLKINKAKNIDSVNAFELKIAKIGMVMENDSIDGRAFRKGEYDPDFKIDYMHKLFEGIIPKQYVTIFNGIKYLLEISKEISKILRPEIIKTMLQHKKTKEEIQTIESDIATLRSSKEESKARLKELKEKESVEQRRLDKEKDKAQKPKVQSEGRKITAKEQKEIDAELQRKEEARAKSKAGEERAQAEKALTKAQEFERNKVLYSKNAMIEDANKEYAKRIPEGSTKVVGGHGFELFMATTGKILLGNKVTMTEDMKSIPESKREECPVDLVTPEGVIECKNFQNEDMTEDDYIAIQQSKLIGNASYALYFNRISPNNYELAVIVCDGKPVIKSKGYEVVVNAKGGIYHYNLLSDSTHVSDETMIPFKSNLGNLYMIDVDALPKTKDKISGSEEYIPSIRIPKKLFDKYI